MKKFDATRRKFLKFIGASTAVAGGAALGIKIPTEFVHKEVVAKVAYTEGPVIVTGSFPKALWPGLEKWYEDTYKRLPTEYESFWEEK
jgi:hypothetical protein